MKQFAAIVILCLLVGCTASPQLHQAAVQPVRLCKDMTKEEIKRDGCNLMAPVPYESGAGDIDPTLRAAMLFSLFAPIR